ncbi:MAG TPA: MFS transporter [Candidatus Binatia bacterium]|nr:MFS transporter [Candidatus Binatia bacterium]
MSSLAKAVEDSADASRTARTFRYERWRAISSGVMETAGSTFLLLIAVRWFHAGAVSKGMIAAGNSLGLLLSPVLVTFIANRGWKTSYASARILAVGSACFALAAAIPVLPLFILCSIVAMASPSMIIPLLTQMYQENYPEAGRGRMFSRTVIIRIATAAVFSKVAGDALSGHLQHFRWLLLAFAVALAFASFCISRCPTQPLASDGSAHPLRGMRYARDDVLFRRTLICWMCMGFANLMMLPLRVEYLANPKYGQMVTVENIALLTGVIPNVARLILSPIWGHVFDRMNFFGLRVTLNVGFAIGILTFFLSGSFTGLVMGAIVYGISNAGGDVAWSLWVTKFAPPERVADYMSVHTFLTGVRGVIAPMIAFYAINHFSLSTMAFATAGLIVVGSLLLVPEIKFRPLRKGTTLVEEVSD